MRQLFLTDEEHANIMTALEQVTDLYELKANDLERSVEVATKRIEDLRTHRQVTLDLRTKVTLAENVEVEFEMDNEDKQQENNQAHPVHTICFCDICVAKRQSLIADANSEQVG